MPQGNNDNNPPENQSDTTPDTPPANAPSDNQPPQPTAGDPAILAAYQQQLLDESRRRVDLERRLATMEAERNAPKPPTPEEEKKFFDTPISAMKDLVQREIREAIAPLNQFTAQTQRANLIEQIKNQMRNNAQFPYINQIENLFDQVISNTPTIDANVAVAAYNTALGYFISQGGSLERKADNPPPAPRNGNPPVNNNPPYVRPTPPAPVNNGGKKQLRPLTENERKIAKYNRQTDKEYLFWNGELDGLSPRDVAHLTNEEIKKRIDAH